MPAMLKNAVRLLVHDRKQFVNLARIKLVGRWCELWSRSGFYFQGRMDIDRKSWWHSPEFVSTSGGYFVPGEPTPIKDRSFEPGGTELHDISIVLLLELTRRHSNRAV